MKIWTKSMAQAEMRKCKNKKDAMNLHQEIAMFYLKLDSMIRRGAVLYGTTEEDYPGGSKKVCRDAKIASEWSQSFIHSKEYEKLPKALVSRKVEESADQIKMNIFEAEYAGTISIHDRNALLEVLQEKVDNDKKSKLFIKRHLNWLKSHKMSHKDWLKANSMSQTQWLDANDLTNQQWLEMERINQENIRMINDVNMRTVQHQQMINQQMMNNMMF